MAAALPIIGLVTSVAGSVFGMISARNQAKFQEELARRNAKIAEDNAARAISRSQVEAQDQDMINLAFLGEQEAVQSASGLGGRSQFLARKSAVELGRRDTLNGRQAGEIEAYNYQVEAMGQRAQASMHRAEAGNALLAGFLNTTRSLIGGVQSIQNPGRFNPYVPRAAGTV